MKAHQIAFMSTLLVCLGAFNLSAKDAPPPPVPTPATSPALPVHDVELVTQPPTSPAPPAPDLIDTIDIQGSIQGRNINFTLEFDFKATREHNTIDLIQGDIVLDQIDDDPARVMRYDSASQTYSLAWKAPGVYHVKASFAVQSHTMKDHTWQEATFQAPLSRVRQLSVICDRADLQVEFPGALRQTPRIKDGKLIITAILGPGHPFTVRWKPQVQKLDAKLVLASRINTIARISSGAMLMDHLFAYQIAQGKLDTLHFTIPQNVSITQVRGSYIRDWQITQVDDAQKLTVTLSQPQTHAYALQILSEMPLATFPIAQGLPVIQPEDGTNSSGHLAVGTDSAISIVIDQSAGLSQMDASSFPRQVLEKQYARPLPTRNAFYYSFASPTYAMDLKLADIVSSFDVTQHLAIQVKEDDLIINTQLELEVRDAPLQQLDVTLPQGYTVSSVTGADVDDYNTPQQGAEDARQLVIDFKKPVLGRTVIQIQMELGATPLQTTQPMTSLRIQGAKTSRGDIQIVGEEGVQFDPPTTTGLREVHAGSLSVRQPGSRFAYRFRDNNWTLDLVSRKKASGIRTESFHLLSIGEGVMYGSVAVNYFISGAPVDELSFQIPVNLGAIEFVGSDVRRWDNNGDIWTVKLSRKVIGDYNLGVFFTRQYDATQPIDFGAVQCLNVETQTGFMTVASHVNLQLTIPDDTSSNLIAITPDEVPANYRLLVNAPVLRSFKYVKAPHASTMVINAYQRVGLLPVVIEMMQLKTVIGINQADGETQTVETVTTVTYKVKNTSSQFLTLKLPVGAMVWSTHLLQYDAQGRESRTRITASQKGDELMIPLKRNRNPNEPTTLEVQYAQSHDPIGMTGQLTIAAPSSRIESTFAQWHVQADPDQGIFPMATGNMLAEARPTRWGDLVQLFNQTKIAWKNGLKQFTQHTTWWLPALCLTLAIVVMTVAFKRDLTGHALFACMIGVVTLNGILASQSGDYLLLTQRIDPLYALDFTQPFTMDANESLRVDVVIKPAWFQYATQSGYLLCPILLIAGLIGGGLIRRGRIVLWSVAGVAALYGGAQFNVIEIGETQIPVMPILAHLLTWGVPALAFLWILWRMAARHLKWSATPKTARHKPAIHTGTATASLLLGVLLFNTGCGTQVINVPL